MRFAGLLTVLVTALLAIGCTQINKGERLSGDQQKPGILERAVGDLSSGNSQEQRSVADQAGVVNTAVQGITGLSVQTAMPWTLVLLLAFDKWLSHRREVWRNARERELAVTHWEFSDASSKSSQITESFPSLLRLAI